MHMNDRVNTYTTVKITQVEAIPIRVPFKVPFKIASGSARPVVDIVLVRLHTNEGVTGVGETQAWRRQGSSETIASLMATINDHFTPHIVGQSPFSIASIMPKLEESVYHSLYAQAAISDALYDLQGKLLNVPVHALLGGKCRDMVGGCAVLTMKPTVEETVEGAAEYYNLGYRSFTVKIGVDPQADVKNVRALRERFADAIIRVDANAGMEFDAALNLLKKLEPFEIDAAEQLLGLWDIDGMADLARRVDIPLMVDECVSTDHDLIEVIRKRAGTVAQTKIAKNGGIWYGRKLWHIADAAGMRIYPGNHPGTSVATAAATHMAAAWNGPLLEGPFAVGIANLADDVATEPIRMEGKDVRVSDAPGLGITLDEEKLKRLRLDK
jgi:L-alanine-DL-glutamate epimerase-like enolase superfamily enzyme